MATDSTYTIQIKFDGDYIDTPAVLFSDFKKKELIYNDLDPSDSVVYCYFMPNITFLNNLRTYSGYPKVKITKEGSDYFTGYLRINYEIAKKNILQPVKVDIVSESFLLKRKIGSCINLTSSPYVCNSANTSNSIVHILLAKAGITDYTLPDLDATIPRFYYSVDDDDDTYHNVLTTLLYEYGYIFSFDASGKFILYKLFTEVTPTPTQVFSGSNIIDEIKQTRAEETYEKVSVQYYVVSTLTNKIVFEDTTNAGDGYACKIEVSPLSYMGDNEEYETSTYSVSEGEVLGCSDLTLNITKQTGIGVVSQELGQTSSILSIYNSDTTYSKYIFRLQIVAGTCVVKTATEYSKIIRVTDSDKYLKYESKYIYNKTYADALATNLSNYYQYCDFTYELKSLDSFAIGSYVTVTETGIGTSVCRIIGKETDENTDVISYTLEAVSEYVEATIVNMTKGISNVITSTSNTAAAVALALSSDGELQTSITSASMLTDIDTTGDGLYLTKTFMGLVSGGIKTVDIENTGSIKIGNSSSYLSYNTTNGLYIVGNGSFTGSVTATTGTLTTLTVNGVITVGTGGSIVGTGYSFGATSSTIGGYSITASTLSATNLVLTSGVSGTANITVGTSSYAGGLASGSASTDILLWAGSTFANRTAASFRVTGAGALVATSATITGAITATSGSFTGSIYASSGTLSTLTVNGVITVGTGGSIVGTGYSFGATSSIIGGYSITASTLSATNLVLTSGVSGTANITVGLSTYAGGLASGSASTNILIWAGSTFANRASASFRVTGAGALVATSATITGAITATSGSFTGSIYASSGTLSTLTVNGVITVGTGGSIVGTGYSFGATSSIIGGLTIATSSMYYGAGNYANADTPYYLNGSTGALSLGNVLYWNPATTTLYVAGTINSINGAMGGWILGSTSLSSASSGASIVLNSYNMRYEIKDSSSIVKVAMGYLGGLTKNGATWVSTKTYAIGEYVYVSGVVYECTVANTGYTPPNTSYWSVSSDTYTTSDYGFWVLPGNSVVCDGCLNLKNGDMIAYDSSIKIYSNTSEILRYGAYTGNYGIHFFVSGTYNNSLIFSSSLATFSAELKVTGDLTVSGGDLISTTTTFNLINTTATTLNIGGVASAINIGASTSTTTFNSTTASTSYTTGSVIIKGGVGITGAIFSNSTLSVTGATTLSSTLAVTGVITSNSTTASTSYTTGSVIIKGGVGITGAIFSNSTLSVTGATTLSSTLAVTGVITSNSTTASTSYTTGSVIIKGGVGITGAIFSNSTLGVAGATTLSSTLGVAGATTLSSTLAVTGATTLSSTLGVAGATTLSSTLAVTGVITSNSTTASTSYTTGSVIIKGGVGITGAIFSNSTLSVAGAVDFNSTLIVAGATTLSSTLAVTGATTLSSTLTVTGVITSNSTTASTSYTTGSVIIKGGVGITGAIFSNSTLSVTGAVDFNSTLIVAGATTLSSTLAVTGATTLSSTLGVAGATTLSSTLAVTGVITSNSTTASTSYTTGSVIIKGGVGITGAIFSNSTLSVTGATTLSSTLTVSDTSYLGNMTFSGNTITASSTLTINTANSLLNIHGSINPYATNTYNLGSADYYWSTIHTRSLYIYSYWPSYSITGGITTAGTNYMRFTDGTQMCWGTTSVTWNSSQQGTGTITFPNNFSVAPNCVMATWLDSSVPNVTYAGGIHITATTTSGATVIGTTETLTSIGGTVGVRWFAIGQWY